MLVSSQMLGICYKERKRVQKEDKLSSRDKHKYERQNDMPLRTFWRICV